MTPNDAQRKQWNDANQARTWPRRERLTTAVTPLLLDLLAPRSGEHILDIGCGGGLTTIAVARAVGPGGSVVGLDLSEPLVGLAKQRVHDAGVTNATFVAGDAQTDAIPDPPFDAAMSQFGVMFFADPVAAFTNIRRGLRPGARLAFACWQPASENPWFPGPLLARHTSPPAPNASAAPPPGPLAFANIEYVRGILESAGFGDIRCAPVACEVAVPDDSIYDEELVASLRLDAEQTSAITKDLRAFADSFRGSDGLLHLRLAPQLFHAVRID